MTLKHNAINPKRTVKTLILNSFTTQIIHIFYQNKCFYKMIRFTFLFLNPVKILIYFHCKCHVCDLVLYKSC